MIEYQMQMEKLNRYIFQNCFSMHVFFFFSLSFFFKFFFRMSSPKKQNQLQNAEFSDSQSSRSEQANGENTINLPSIQPRILSPRVNRSSPVSYINDISKTLPKDLVTQCKMIREKRGISHSYVYRLFGEEEAPIFIAKTESSIFSTKFSIIDPITGSKIGAIQSNATSLIYDVTGPNCHFKIEYDENFMGRHGPRSFKVTFLDTEKNQVFVLKPPIVINGEYYQDFHDLATVPSIKNFICVAQNNFAQEVCIFVRNPDNTFTLRITDPFSLYHAFCLALTSLHTGLFHR